MNFEKSTGYITIPDQYVVYTKLNEDGDQLGGVDPATGNEGQKMVWGLQDMSRTINDRDIEAPQLLQGINIRDEEDEQEVKVKHKKQAETKAQQ